MKLKITKRWYQFWIPKIIEVESPDDAAFRMFYADLKEKMLTLYPDSPNGTTYNPVAQNIAGDGEAIEADEAEPWYGGEAVEAEDGGVVTAEPPIVYASRCNAKMAERAEINKQ